MASYKVSPEAEADLYRIWLYGLEQWGLAAADRYNAAFFKHFEQLAEQPLLYPAVDDLRQGDRRSVCGSDSVYYRIEGQIVEIMAIIGQQDVSKWL
jgi:toxin ParE1/3/4